MNIKLAVLASGRGSNFKAILDSIRSGKLEAEIKILISDNRSAKALQIAEDFNVKHLYIPYNTANKKDFEKKAVEKIKKEKCDIIILAGFMRVLSPYFVNSFKDRILNIHPALLPSFPGLNAPEQALNHGVKITGCTVHIVNNKVDAGKIILQKAVPVKDNDTVETLSKRILKQEHKLYTRSINKYKKYICNSDSTGY